jgi:hypothetical protein
MDLVWIKLHVLSETGAAAAYAVLQQASDLAKMDSEADI